ncbi:MAG: extracellular solute-binding protein [Ruminococcus flavefaciens]|nr:extracellular solute-binding protein [Ruminococcus flavefaciens]MCM1228930.1 extracellular solute-binding protein [Ruminococcus flavefaciens]
MKNLKKLLAVLAVVMTSAFSCAETVPSVPVMESSQPEEIPATEEIEEDEPFDISGQTITWLADYDLNPAENNQRSVALALFEDVYGAKINFVSTTAENKYDRLSEMLAGGEEVDMFPYDETAFPNGVIRNWFQPLDPYFDVIGIDEGLWDDMSGVIDMFEYDNQHYVMPYEISNPIVITYSRKLMEQEGLDDPYELYKKGEWNWDTMMTLMRKFVDNHTGITKYGINGCVGEGIIASTGTSVVDYSDGKFVNNINAPELKKSGEFMQNLAKMNLVDNSYIGHFPMDNSTLFFAMGDWALGTSNALNPDGDLMIVPFPKSPEADKNYISCNFGARMLVRNSTKGEAVATYIKCERIASTQEEYKSARKEQALLTKKTASGTVEYFVTEEQYDALQSYLDTADVVPMFDFAYGMGEKMNSEGDYTYETRGVMNNLSDSIIDGRAESWKKFCEKWKDVIDDTVKEFNK